MDVVYLVSRPYTATAGVKLSNTSPIPAKEGPDPMGRRIRHIRRRTYSCLPWPSPACSPAPAKLSCSVPWRRKSRDLTDQVGAFLRQGRVRHSTTHQNSGRSAPTQPSAATNKEINDNMLGWVGTSTTASQRHPRCDSSTRQPQVLNAKLSAARVLYDPITEVLNCLVLLKIQGVEKGLTWVHDNAHINFPPAGQRHLQHRGRGQPGRVPGDPPDSFLADPGSAASDKISCQLSPHWYRSVWRMAIRTEALISTVILLIWVFIVLMPPSARALYTLVSPRQGSR